MTYDPLPIVLYPDPVLLTRCEPVESITPEIADSVLRLSQMGCFAYAGGREGCAAVQASVVAALREAEERGRLAERNSALDDKNKPCCERDHDRDGNCDRHRARDEKGTP